MSRTQKSFAQAAGCSGMVLTSAIVERLTRELQRLGVKNVRLD